MRVAQDKLATCTEFCVSCPRLEAAGRGILRVAQALRSAFAVVALVLAATALVAVQPASAASNTYTKSSVSDGLNQKSSKSAFPESPGGPFGKPQKLDK